MATLATSGQVLGKAGVNVSPNLSGQSAIWDSGQFGDDWILEAEGQVNTASRKNWVDEYATLNVDVKNMLSGVVSNLAAIYAIQYDMSGYTSRVEAEDMVNILRDAALRELSIIREAAAKDFVENA